MDGSYASDIVSGDMIRFFTSANVSRGQSGQCAAGSRAEVEVYVSRSPYSPCPSSGFGDCLHGPFDFGREVANSKADTNRIESTYPLSKPDTCTMGFEACCLFFAAPPVEDDEATLVWSPAAAFSSRKGQKAKKSNNNASTNPTKDLRAFEGRDETACADDEEEVTLHSYLSSIDDADDWSRRN